MGNSVVDLGQGGFRPEISFSGGIMESTPQIASIDGDPVYGDLRTKQARGRIGGSYETSSGDVFGAGVSGGMEKSRLELPSSLQALGAPARIDQGEGKIRAQSYDAFAELSDVFGIEGAKALIRGNYSPSSRGEDSYGAGVNLSMPFENGGDVPEGIMSVDLSKGADTTGPDTMQPIPQYPGIEGFDIYKDLAPEQFKRRPVAKQNFDKKRGFQFGQMVELRDDAVGGKLLKQAGIMTPVDQVKQTVDPKVMDQMSRILGREVV